MKSRKSLSRPGGLQALWVIVLTALMSLNLSCESPKGPPPTLEELHTDSRLKQSAKRLIHIPLGLHRLTPATHQSPKVIMAIHGYDSRGYEWVSSLHQFAESGAHVYWLRWDWNQCPQGGLADLQKALKQVHAQIPQLAEIEVFGHSYGGVISALLAQSRVGTLPLKVHAIASPLAGMGKLKTLCPATQIDGGTLAKNVAMTQWRTQHKIDGAFKDEARDPQLVSLPGAKTIDLPGSFDGHRLGHNWSVSYVATQWLAQQKAALSGTNQPETIE